MLPSIVIARVEFTHEGRPAVAEFTAARYWTCTAPVWLNYLNRCAVMADFSPSAGDATLAHVRAMARVLGGRAMMRPRSPLPAGTVY